MRQYIALIHKDTDSDYGVSFPDLPGCISAGITMDEARAMAEEALALHLEGLAEDGEAVPEPSSLETVMADRENRDAVAILVPVRPAAPKAVRVNITIPEDALAEVDAYAESIGFTRSGFMTAASLAAASTKTIRGLHTARGTLPLMIGEPDGKKEAAGDKPIQSRKMRRGGGLMSTKGKRASG